MEKITVQDKKYFLEPWVPDPDPDPDPGEHKQGPGLAPSLGTTADKPA